MIVFVSQGWSVVEVGCQLVGGYLSHKGGRRWRSVDGWSAVVGWWQRRWWEWLVAPINAYTVRDKDNVRQRKMFSLKLFCLVLHH